MFTHNKITQVKCIPSLHMILMKECWCIRYVCSKLPARWRNQTTRHVTVMGTDFYWLTERPFYETLQQLIYQYIQHFGWLQIIFTICCYYHLLFLNIKKHYLVMGYNMLALRRELRPFCGITDRPIQIFTYEGEMLLFTG